MAYSKLNLRNGQKLNQDHLAHIENGIVANEAELAKKASQSDIPDVSGFITKSELSNFISNQNHNRLGWWETQINATKVATLNRSIVGANGHSFQGAAIYKNMLFAALNANGEMVVYDMFTNAPAGSIAIPETEDYHNNNIDFGYEFYDEKDEFPLLYMSQENNDVHKCIVARITRNRNEWKWEIVQTITFPTAQENGMWWANSYIDAENGYMYLMGYKNQSWTDGSNENRLVSRRWILPKLADGDVALKVADSTHYHEIAYWTATQGAVMKGGKLYQAYGTPTYKDWIKFRVLDLEKGTVEHVMDLYNRGLPAEPEGVDYYNGNLYIVDVAGNLYRLDFVEEPLRDTYEPLPTVGELTEEELNELMMANTKYGGTQDSAGSLDSYYNGKRVKIYVNDAYQFNPKGLEITAPCPAGMKYGITLFNTNVNVTANMNASNGTYDSGNVYGGWSTDVTTHDFTPYSGWVRFQATVAKTNGSDKFTEDEYNAVIDWWKNSAHFTN